MIHLVIYTHPKIGRSYSHVERDMPKDKFADPETYFLDPDCEIEAVIHNTQPVCSLTIVNKLSFSNQKDQRNA